MELLLIIGLGALLGAGLWLVRSARRMYHQPDERAPRTEQAQPAERLWWPQTAEPVPRDRWSSLRRR